MLNKIRRLGYLVWGFIVYRICAVIPPKKNLWIFGSWEGTAYSDNTKFFYEYINREQKNIKAIWLSKDNQTIKKIRDLNFKAYYTNSPLGIWYSARAEYAFTTSFIQNVLNSFTVTKSTKLVNLWHGTPLKVLGKDHDRITTTGEVKKKKQGPITTLKNRLWPALFPFVERPDDYFLTPSPEAYKTLKSAFPGGGHTKHFICPYPRNDAFKNSNNQSKEVKKIIYMPTWRQFKGKPIDLFTYYNFDVIKIDEYLNNNDMKLYLKLHKYSRMSTNIKAAIEESKNIIHLDTCDIYDTINEYDLLITDYSSIYFDYLYTNNPIIFAPFDIDNYLSTDHRFYYDYETVTPGPKAYNWDEVIKYIDEFKKDRYLYSKEREENQKRFNPFNEGPFSEKLYTMITEGKLEE